MISVTEYLFDTNVIIDFLRKKLSEETKELLRAGGPPSISIITFIETCKYFMLAGKSSQWEKIKGELEGFRILAIGTTTGELAARLSAKNGLSLADSIIYATAISNGLMLATLDNEFRNKKGTIILK